MWFFLAAVCLNFPIIEVKGAEIETAAVEASPDVPFEFESQSFSWM